MGIGTSRILEHGRVMIFKTALVRNSLLVIMMSVSVVWGQPGEYPGSKVIEYMNLDAGEIARQTELNRAGVQEMAPLLLPEGEMEAETKKSRFRFMGWPHSVIIDDVIIVFIRYPELLVRSTDGGQTWEEPLFLEDFGIAVMCATASGKVIAAAVDKNIPNTVNVLISEDKGKTWSRHSTNVTNPPPHLTSRMIEHPDFGLIAGAHYSDHVQRDSLYFLVSGDEGQTWKVARFPVNVPLIVHGNIVFNYGAKDIGAFVRNKVGPGLWSPFANFTPTNLDKAERFQDLIWTGGYTNIWVTLDDTPDAVFNPISGRIEAVTTKRGYEQGMERSGGFPSRDSGYLTLNLWSMAPEDFRAGSTNWRYEGPLLRSKGEWGYFRDGGHPSGTIVDERRGVQHLFIYMGDRSHAGRMETGRTGTFRISRTLDTEAWVRENGVIQDYRSNYQIVEDFTTFADWSNISGNVRFFHSMICIRPHRASEAGLQIRADQPGFYGLGHDKVIVTDNYRIQFKSKICRSPEVGYPLGIHVNYGAEKYDLIVKPDGLYELEGEDLAQQSKIISAAVDTNWHIWEVEVSQGRAKVSMDGIHIGDGSTRIDASIGQRPVVISTMVGDENGRAEMQMEYFHLENLEVAAVSENR